jgi:anti-sigma-K factor RskA
MKLTNPQLRNLLAAEYVLGTLRGAARARFQSLLKYDADLRLIVANWETRLTPLALAARDIAPPKRVWERIAARIAYAQSRRRWWASLTLWRSFAVAGIVAAITLGVAWHLQPVPEPPIVRVAVMQDEQARVAAVVSWPPWRTMREPRIKLRIVSKDIKMPDNMSWELWMLPARDAAPVSLGLVTMAETQFVPLRSELTRRLGKAWGVALSVEPKGGSPRGKPTGRIIMKGQCVKIR